MFFEARGDTLKVLDFVEEAFDVVAFLIKGLGEGRWYAQKGGSQCLMVFNKQAQIVINTWLMQYNHVRAHQYLNMRLPVPKTIQQDGT